MNSKPLVVYPDADENEPDHNDRVRSRIETFCEYKQFLGEPQSDQEFLSRLEGAAGVLLGWGIPPAVLESTSDLKVISFSGIGVGKFVDLEIAERKGITVCNCPGYSDVTVAEHAMGLLLSCAKHIPELDKQLRNGKWNQSNEAFELRGKTIGLVGFGGIAKHFSNLCQAFGMKVKTWTRSRQSGFDDQLGVEFCSLEEIYADSDVISLHIASNPQTNNIVDAEAFEKMRDGVVFINTARAELVDENAFVTALDSGKVGSAGVDVYHQEPLSPSHALIQMDNVVLTPHVAYNSPEAKSQLYEIAVYNLENYFAGNPCNVVSPTS
jgi:D-3-phosphoglycerate dehydrogenase